MKLASKHTREQSGVITDFLGGINKALPPFAIAQNELIDATNFYYNPASGFLTTREGLKKYTTQPTPANSPIIGITKLVSGSVVTVCIVCEDGKLYKLDGDPKPVLVGTLSGVKRPSFSQLAGKLTIASGGALNTYDGTTFATTASPNIDYISDTAKKDTARIVGCGNASYPDRIYLSGSNDPAYWTFNASPESDAKYFDCGYKDGLDAIGVAMYRNRLFVFKKSYDSTTKAQYAANIMDVSANWSVDPFSEYHSTLSPHFIVNLGSVLLYVDIEGPKITQPVESLSELPYSTDDHSNKISGEMSQYISSDGFSILDPKKRIVMIKPQKNHDYFYCLDYVGGRWTIFRFAKNILCGAYINGKMLFGASDGYVYEYDTSLHQDDGLDYIKSVESKWFNQFPLERELLKEKELDILGITNGSMSLSVKNKGEQVYSRTATFEQTWLPWSTVNTIAPANWTESLNKIIYRTVKDKNRRAIGDYVSFQINVTSGLCSLSQIRARVASTGRS